MPYNEPTFVNETTRSILNIVDEWESSDKSDFIEELMNVLTETQRQQILYVLANNEPLTHFA